MLKDYSTQFFIDKQKRLGNTINIKTTLLKIIRTQITIKLLKSSYRTC